MIGSLACGIRDTATIYKALLILALFHSFSHKVSYSFTHWGTLQGSRLVILVLGFVIAL